MGFLWFFFEVLSWVFRNYGLYLCFSLVFFGGFVYSFKVGVFIGGIDRKGGVGIVIFDG